jgi:hypothetical protein
VKVFQSYVEKNRDEDSLKEPFKVLRNRLSNSNVVIALKAHILFHTHAFSDNNRTLPKYYLWQYITENLSGDTSYVPSLQDSMAQSSTHQRLLIAYNKYVRQRIEDYEILKIDPTREKIDKTSIVDTTTSLNISHISTALLDQSQCIIVQVKLILDCIFTPELLENSLYQCCYNLLATDLSILFHFLNLAVVYALQNFFSLARRDAERTLFIYKEFTQLQIADEVSNFVMIAPNMVDPNEVIIPHALQQSKESIQHLTKSLESYLFKTDDNNKESNEIYRHNNYNDHNVTTNDTTTTNHNNNNTATGHPRHTISTTISSELDLSHCSTTTDYTIPSSEYTFSKRSGSESSSFSSIESTTTTQHGSHQRTRRALSSADDTIVVSSTNPPNYLTNLKSRPLSKSRSQLLPQTPVDEEADENWRGMFDSLIVSDSNLSLDLDSSFVEPSESSLLVIPSKPLPPPPSPLQQAHQNFQTKTKSIMRAFRKSAAT